MRAVAVKALAANANRPMKVKPIYAAMVEAGYVQGAGKTPTATLSVVLLKGDEFEKTGPGEYRLTTAAYKTAKAQSVIRVACSACEAQREVFRERHRHLRVRLHGHREASEQPSGWGGAAPVGKLAAEYVVRLT